MEFRQFKKRLSSMRQEILPEEFLTRLLPFPADKAQELLNKLTDNTFYDGECWPSLCVENAQVVQEMQLLQEPQEALQETGVSHSSPFQQSAPASSSPGKRRRESWIYQPFVRIAQNIAEMSADSSQNHRHVPGVWVDPHSQEPETNDLASELMPDICFVQGDNPRAENLAVRDWRYMTQNMESQGINFSALRAGGSRSISNREHSRCWLQVYSVVEIKRDKDYALAQLSTYVSQIFAECIDRLFVIAFTLNDRFLRIHLFDRSGIVSSGPIDIHNEPLLFVTALASYSALTPEQLGWDPSIEVWDGDCVVPSYNVKMQHFASAYNVPWVISAFGRTHSAPSESQRASAASGTGQRRRYVMVRCITLQDAKRLLGRAAILMEVVSLEDWKNKNEQAHIYVMKQSWQQLLAFDGDVLGPVNSSLESGQAGRNQQLEQELQSIPFEEFILRRTNLDSRLEVAGFVQIEGRSVETLTYIRKGIHVKSKPKRRPKLKYAREYARDQELHLIRGNWRREPIIRLNREAKTQPPAVIYRTLTRMILRIPGPTIRECTNLIDFLNGFRGALDEHEKCYRAGIIQRDISDYNIIISNGEGHLIDFDCSKVTQRFQPQVNGDHQRIEESFRQPLLERFEESVISRAEEIMGSSGSAKHYLTGLLVNNVHTRPLSFNDLGWCEELYDIPSSGNLCYAGLSHGTISSRFTSCMLYDDSEHTAIHDVESFLWVLGHSIIRYSRPGGPPREMTSALRRALSMFMGDSDSKKQTKRQLLNDKNCFTELLEHVSPEFEVLKDLMHAWRRVLYLAYGYRSGMEFKYPHRAFLGCIERAIEALGVEPNVEQAGSEDQSLVRLAIRRQQTIDCLLSNPANVA